MLAPIGTDVQKYIENEKRLHPDGFIVSKDFEKEGYPARRYIFEADPIHGSSVSWEWVFRPESPAYLVLREFSILALQGHDWKFHVFDWKARWPCHLLFTCDRWKLGLCYCGCYPSPERRNSLETRWA